MLAALVPQQSRSQLQRLIKDGHVTVEGKPATRTNTPVTAGQSIGLDVPAARASEAVAQDLPLEIVFEDSDLLVINKAAGMVVHPAAGHSEGTLVNALLHHVDDLSGVGGELRPGIVHRLDRGTSGLIVVAENDVAHAELARQFQDREVEKEYIALIWGLLPPAGDRADRTQSGNVRRCRRTAGARATR